MSGIENKNGRNGETEKTEENEGWKTTISSLLSFSYDFAKQEYTTYFGSGSKSALTQSILHGLA